MVYGELDAGEIDLCDDDAWYGHLNSGTPLSNYSASDPINCTPGYWLQPFMMSLFLVVASILLLTMLIATFNAIFLQAQNMSNQIWLFQRYNQVIQYEWTPCIPPPFTPIYYIYMLFKYVKYRQGYWWRPNSGKIKKKHERNIGSHAIGHRHTLFELSLKLYLSQEQIEKLHDFEEECMDQLSRAKETTKLLSTDERIKRTCERTEAVYTKLDETLDVRPEFKLETHPEEGETDLKVSEIKSSCEIKVGRYERKFSSQPDSSKFYTRQLSKNWAGYTSITDAIIVQDIELGPTPGGISRTISMSEATSSKEPMKREDSMDLLDLLESDDNIDANSKIEEEIGTIDQVFESDGDIDNSSIDNK
uniref:Uncharacterized protein n=1 Tax=Acrobeloides nanus TaxID=290746 RepID=A0A914DXJ0_9BILA